MNDVTAIVLSPAPVKMAVPGCHVYNRVSYFDNAAGHYSAWLAALQNVETEWFCFIDSDDELPPDFERILNRCISVDAPLAYTDELVTDWDMNAVLRKSESYSQDVHIHNPMLIHHLAVCRTEAARCAALVIPRGEYAVEPLLFFQVAKEGAVYVEEMGYIWHRRDGLSRKPGALIAQVQSATWAARNRGRV